MSLTDKIIADLTAAMRAKDADKLSVLRMVKANLMNRKIDKGEELTDDEIMKALQSLVKQRRDSVEQYEKAGRDDLAAKEKTEIVVIEAYLPQGATQEEIDAAVAAAIAETGASSMKEMGTVMKATMANLAGKTADGKMVSEAPQPARARAAQLLRGVRAGRVRLGPRYSQRQDGLQQMATRPGPDADRTHRRGARTLRPGRGQVHDPLRQRSHHPTFGSRGSAGLSCGRSLSDGNRQQWHARGRDDRFAGRRVCHVRTGSRADDRSAFGRHSRTGKPRATGVGVARRQVTRNWQ